MDIPRKGRKEVVWIEAQDPGLSFNLSGPEQNVYYVFSCVLCSRSRGTLARSTFSALVVFAPVALGTGGTLHWWYSGGTLNPKPGWYSALVVLRSNISTSVRAAANLGPH